MLEVNDPEGNNSLEVLLLGGVGHCHGPSSLSRALSIDSKAKADRQTYIFIYFSHTPPYNYL